MKSRALSCLYPHQPSRLNSNGLHVHTSVFATRPADLQYASIRSSKKTSRPAFQRPDGCLMTEEAGAASLVWCLACAGWHRDRTVGENPIVTVSINLTTARGEGSGAVVIVNVGNCELTTPRRAALTPFVPLLAISDSLTLNDSVPPSARTRCWCCRRSCSLRPPGAN